MISDFFSFTFVDISLDSEISFKFVEISFAFRVFDNTIEKIEKFSEKKKITIV